MSESINTTPDDFHDHVEQYIERIDAKLDKASANVEAMAAELAKLRAERAEIEPLLGHLIEWASTSVSPARYKGRHVLEIALRELRRMSQQAPDPVDVDDVFEAIRRERYYQDEKWGTLEERPHTVGEWLLIIEGELAEAKHAWTKGISDADALRETLQVAAVAVAALQNCGIVERRPDEVKGYLI
jgi:hypothetical protein